MIKLLTGQPGHGKTLRAIELAMQERAKGRAVYACRVRGLDTEKTGFLELESLSTWQDLPDGSVILCDECYEDIPVRGPGKPLPEWEKDLATHRHRGFDFILICQMGSQISTHVRALVNDHTHVRRKFGFERSTLLTWDRYQASVASNAEVRDARKQTWKYPREVFDLYKSAEVHTVKRSLPWQVFAVPLLAALVGGCFWFVFHRWNARADAITHHEAADVGAASAATSGPQPVQVPDKPMTADEYLGQFRPRVPGMPWSAPFNDGRKPKADPDIYCMDIEDSPCRCYTEQVTRLQVPQHDCRLIARFGIYNPFRNPPARQLQTRYPAEVPMNLAAVEHESMRRGGGGRGTGDRGASGPRYMPIDPAGEGAGSW